MNVRRDRKPPASLASRRGLQLQRADLILMVYWSYASEALNCRPLSSLIFQSKERISSNFVLGPLTSSWRKHWITAERSRTLASSLFIFLAVLTSGDWIHGTGGNQNAFCFSVFLFFSLNEGDGALIVIMCKSVMFSFMRGLFLLSFTSKSYSLKKLSKY